jgi:uncharacterized membrane protein
VKEKLFTAFPPGALVRRELLASLRRPRTFLYLFAFTGLSLAYIMWAYPTGHIPVSQAATFSRQLFLKLQGLLYASCFLFIPGLAGSSIASERENDTFDLLSLSLIGPAGIFLSKLLNAAGLYLFMLFAIFPVLGTAFFLTGVDWVELCFSLITMALVALGLALGGLLFTIYGLSVAHVNDMVDASRVLEVTGGLLLLHGAGAALGPTLAGALMDALGPESLMIYFAATLVLLSAYVAKRIRAAAPVPEAEKFDFVVMGSGSQAVLQLDPRAVPEGGDATPGDAPQT